jgi:hypothetical protein
MAAEICSAQADLYKSWQCFRRMCVDNFFRFNLSLSLYVFVVRLAANIFVKQTRNYILKCVNSSVLLPKWQVR